MTDLLPPAISADNLQVQRHITDRASRLAAPLFDDKLMANYSEDEQINLDRICLEAEASWALESQDELRTTVLARFCELLPHVGLVATAHDPATADWHWSRVRMLISAAGWTAHSTLADICCRLYPQCALDPTETESKWREELEKAHTVSGWPSTTALISWADAWGACDIIDVDSLKGKDGRFWKALALLHLLKHARDDGNRLVITYQGTASYVRYEDGTNVIGQMKRVAPQMRSLLGVIADGRKSEIHPLGHAFNSIMSSVSVRALLRREPMAGLPGMVLHGAWSSLSPDPMRNTGFVQHGLRLTGVWIASNGRVAETAGSDDDVTRYQWRLESETDDIRLARERFQRALPTTFGVEFPSNLVRWAFPNLNLTMFQDPDAALALYDAVICLGMVRNEVNGGQSEYPMLMVMPSDPTPEDSTNQGKSKCAQLLAQVFAPDIPVTNAADNESAPDQRTLAALITQHGSLCLDEWRQARSRNSLLGHDSLQSLITGGARPMGRVFENGATVVRLRQPIIASTKCADLPPDMLNRTLCLWLDTLGEDERSRLDVVNEMDSGRLPLRIRLAAVAMCQKYGLSSAAPRASTAFRFPATFGMAIELYHLRTGKDREAGVLAVTEAVKECGRHLSSHTAMADDTGLLAQQEDALSVRLRLSSLFDNMMSSEVEMLAELCRVRADDGGSRISTASLIKARGELANLSGRPLSTIVSFVVGTRMMVSDRAISLALNREVRRLMPEVGSEWVLPDSAGLAGWRLIRCADGGAVRVRLQRNT